MKSTLSIVLLVIGVLAPRLTAWAVPADFTVAVPGLPVILDPHGPAFWAPNSPLPNVYETLLTRDAEGRISPGLAVSWTLSPDGRRLELKLRPGVKFHNGEAFTAAAAKFSLDRFLGAASRQAWGTPWRVIQKVEAVERLLLRVFTAQPTPALVGLLATGGAVVSPDNFKAGEAAALARPVGTGPFVFKHLKVDDLFVADAFRDYWDGTASTSTVVFRSVPDAAARSAGLLRGDFHIATDLAPGDLDRLKASSHVRIAPVPGLRSVVISLNTQGGGALADSRVRRALAHAIDAEELIRQLRRGFATRTAAPAPPTVLPASSIKPFRFDVARARRLLTDAGYAAGLRLGLDTLASRHPTDDLLAEMVRQQLRAVGIDVDVRRHDPAAFVRLFAPGKQPAMALLGLRAATLDPQDYFEPLLSSKGRFSGYSNPAVDGLLDRATVEADPKARLSMYERVTTIAQETAPVIPLFQEHQIYGVVRPVTWSPRADEKMLLVRARFMAPAAKNGGGRFPAPAPPSPAPPTPAPRISSDQAGWNVWAEPSLTRAFKPVLFLSPGTTYSLSVDLAAMLYAVPGVSARPASGAFRQRLDEWLAQGVSEVHLQLVMLHDPFRFEPPKAPVQTLTVKLDRVRAHLAGGTPVGDVFAEMRARRQLGSDPPFLYGRAEFLVTPRASPGPASLGMSVWADNRPVEEFSSEVCIAANEAEARSVCRDPAPIAYTLGGFDSVRLALEGSARPDAALHFIELPDGAGGREVHGVFRRNDAAAGVFVTWRLDESASALETELAQTVMPSFFKATDDTVLQSVGRGLYNVLFPSNPDRKDAAAARRALERFVAAHPRLTAGLPAGKLPPSIFVRAVLPTLRSELMLPIGLMYVNGDFVGFSFRVELPLPIQSYATTTGCITRWFMALPPQPGAPGIGAALNQALGVFAGRIAGPRGWDANAKVYREMGALRQWLGNPGRELDRAAFFVTSHHKRNTLFFREGDGIFPGQIERVFAPASVAVLNGCGTGEPGATDIIVELNQRGIGAVIATANEVRGELAGWFLACLAEGVDKAGQRAPTMAELHFSALQCARGKRGQHETADYGGRVLAYMLLGNGNLALCAPRKQP
jgi:peptide/nickel transport system substrate-binding protein